jgi:hypothetical protein
MCANSGTIAGGNTRSVATLQGKPTDYNRDVALDVVQLLAFLQATQPKAVETLELARRASSAPSSCTGCRARSPSAAWSMCCARA